VDVVDAFKNLAPEASVVTAPLSLSDFDYDLPEELIAQEPLAERDRSRLLHLRGDGSLAHHVFADLPSLLAPGDLVVVNDSRVFPARLLGRKSSGGAVELLLLERLEGRLWRVLARPGKKLRLGATIAFGGGELEAEVVAVEDEGRKLVRFSFEGEWNDVVDALGRTPLPPYIEASRDEAATRARYQTVYARERGSIAAPTAGLHFTEGVFRGLEARGLGVAHVTLHVGYATFEPVRAEDLSRHRMGVERYRIPGETAERIEAARAAGGRVVAIGTTTVRALESAALDGFAPGWRETALFITPGFRFRVVSGLLTNFHLPKSTLLVLVSALGGVENVRRAYGEAVVERYRFYSFGDAMLLYPALHGAT